MKHESRIMNLGKFKRKRLFLILLILNSLFLILYSAPLARAQDFSTSVKPPLIQLRSQASANIISPIKLKNDSDQITSYSILLIPFKANAEKNGFPNYDPDLADEYQDFFTRVKLMSEDQEITEITLNPKEEKELFLNINLTNKKESNDYYFTVMFVANVHENKLKTSHLANQGGIGTNVLLSVEPEEKSKIKIANFTTSKIAIDSPIDFTLELENQADNLISTKGTVVITDIFNRQVSSLAFGPTNILKKSTRLIGNNDELNPKLTWHKKAPLGLYSAEVKINSTSNEPILNQTITFFAIPLKLSIALVLFIIFFAWILKRLSKKLNEK